MQEIASTPMCKKLIEARLDPCIKAVVIRIDSPGALFPLTFGKIGRRESRSMIAPRVFMTQNARSSAPKGYLPSVCRVLDLQVDCYCIDGERAINPQDG